MVYFLHKVLLLRSDFVIYQTVAMQFKGHLTKKPQFDQKEPKEWTISTGDIINIHDKQEDGWWLGELKGQVGIFPATYVEDIIPK